LIPIPNFLYRHIARRPNLVKILDNIGWLFFDKALRMGMGLLVGVWVARYLGPEQFGQLNYAIAFVALFGAVATLGLNGVVVRDLVKDPDEGGTILGTALVLQLVGALLAVGMIVSAILLLRPDDTRTQAMVVILGIGLMFKSSSVIKYWFESQVQSKNVVWVENGVFLLLSAIKVGLILKQAPLMAFVWVVLAEAILVTVGFIGIYLIRVKAFRTWSVSLDRAKKLLSDSWPMILSSIATMIYMRIDQLMLREIVGTEAVGIYSAALRLSEIWYMLPMIIMASLFPAIIESKKKSEALFNNRTQQLLNLMMTTALVIAICVTLSADWLISFLFGMHYAESATVLMIHIWAAPFIFMGVASSKWFLIKDLQVLGLYRVIYGCVVNVVLNYFLIPTNGVKGAAFATLISQIVATYLYDATNRTTRELFIMKTKSFLFFLNFKRSA
jgi:polysaccharide transporter, PST family